ncbi:hypothetical protein [Pseudoxanthomonas sacheonensis]|uniref:hypothetical protein n=1 Tax=Pseudoxanthomonas sacheonensis TaxID=443615 RepID=UPI0013D46C60|nr:hypothetical protein [Pseudoxanthomonas sacheonensis]KAF1709029.1 hypothetical protein CSC73_07210 [Pseudoxanthomonas sacheonensis]
MRFIAPLLLAFALVPMSAVAQQDPAARSPFVVEQTYWIKPGKELQFIGLFEKNRIPLLRAKIKDGRILWARLSRPRFNSANEQWDLRVTVAWRDADSAVEPVAQGKTQLTTEQQIIEELVVERTDVPIQEWNVNISSN